MAEDVPLNEVSFGWSDWQRNPVGHAIRVARGMGVELRDCRIDFAEDLQSRVVTLRSRAPVDVLQRIVSEVAPNG